MSNHLEEEERGLLEEGGEANKMVRTAQGFALQSASDRGTARCMNVEVRSLLPRWGRGVTICGVRGDASFHGVRVLLLIQRVKEPLRGA